MTQQTRPPDDACAVALLSADPDIVDEVQRLAAAAGVQLSVPDLPLRRDRWPEGLVLVGFDQARALSRSRGPRRPGLVLVALGTDDELGGGRADAAWRHAVALGAEQVALLPPARDWLVDRLARTVEPPSSAHVVGVLGGCGGAGASLFAVALAVAGAESGRRTLLADLDQLGGGLDVATGLDDVPGLRWPDLAAARGRLPASSLHESLPRTGSLAVLAWGRGEPVGVPVASLDAVLDAAGRGHELLVLDLPRALDAATECALARVDELLVVVPARMRAVLAARQLVAALGPHTGRALVVARRGPGDRWTGRRVADAVGLPLAAVLREDARIDADLDRGQLPGARPRSPSRRAAEQCLAAAPRGPRTAAAVA